MPLKQTLSRHWFRFQRELFPWLEEALGPLGERYERLGHVPIIDLNPRRRPQVKAERKREALAQRRIGHLSPEARRYRERLTVERVNGRLKDEFGGRHLRVRGPGKVWCHLMFGILALTVEQLMRLML